jgi:GT2 family glycosyltransferase
MPQLLPSVIPLQQLDSVPDAAPGTWMSRGVDPQFLIRCQPRGGWFRIHFKMTSAERARVEIYADTGNGLDGVECIERISFTGSMERFFFVNVPRPVRGFRFDPLDREGLFRLEVLQIESVSRLGLLGEALAAAVKGMRRHRAGITSLWQGVKLLCRGQRADIKKKLLENLRGPSPLAPPAHELDRTYDLWRQRRQLTRRERDRIKETTATLVDVPRISLLMPVGEASEINLYRTVGSVVQQLYPHWELCIVGDEATRGRVGALLGSDPQGLACFGGVADSMKSLDTTRQSMAPVPPHGTRDPRIKVCFVPGAVGRAAALNTALALASGGYCAVLDPNDELAEEALFRVAENVAADPDTDMLYSDEDLIGTDGRHIRPFFKPDWSPETMLSFMYTGSLSTYRTELVRELGGFREEFEPAEDYDLALRVAARSRHIRHIPKVLYHRREQAWGVARGASRVEGDACGERGRLDLMPHASRSTPHAEEAGRRAVAAYLDMTGREATVEAEPGLPVYRVRFAITGQPKISIIIPTAYRQRTFQGETTTYLARCLSSIRDKSTYSNYEILLLDNSEPPAAILGDLARWGLNRAPYAQPFNWAAAMNRGAARARGQHLLFLDDDTEVISPDWLQCLLEYSQQEEIGVVGARLHLPDGRLQHAGITIQDGCPGHPFYGYPASHTGYFFSSVAPRNYSAVTGACLMTRADVFHAVGGFSETFALYFNDVDYCLKVGSSERRVVCNPNARLYHFETATKSTVNVAEHGEFKERWSRQRPLDPYYNPNLSPRFHDFRLEADW